MPVDLETNRLKIRNFHSSDGPALHTMIVQYESSEMAPYDQTWPTEPDQVQQVANWFASGDDFLAVCLKESGQFIGFVSLNPAQDAAYDLGYIFKFDFHGKGYASEACRAILTHAFERLHAHQVAAGTAAQNHASCRLLERLGFVMTSENKASFRNDPDGAPIEFIGCSYRLTQEAWVAANQPSVTA